VVSEVKIDEDFQEEVEEISGVEIDSEKCEDNLENEPAKDIEKELADALDEIADLRDKMLRAAAENENVKKRIERERLASLKYAGEYIFREILPVVDNLERATDQGDTEGADAEKNLTALLEGVQLTLKSLMNTLEKFEVKVSKSVGEPFDPKHQEALTMAPSDMVPTNHVISEFEKGYYYKDRLLRAAKVVVSSGKNEDDSE
jgi:molecular chaperone GrpE